MKNLFIVGFPSYYGGAGTELHHQIYLWVRAFPDIKLYLIPTMTGYKNEPLYQEMIDLGIEVEETGCFDKIEKEDAVINFCSDFFLENLEVIKEKTDRITFVNCMTSPFKKEKQKANKNLIKYYLYQRQGVMENMENTLRAFGADANFMTFVPYFNPEGWEFSVKNQEYTNIGRISRKDADKFSNKTTHIYEYITSPKIKRGHFLGFVDSLQSKIGKVPSWIKTYENQKVLPVKDFYDRVDFIVQPTDTMENWPRIGFEAMYSGKPLVVDNRGGWRHLIEHKETGFLCNTYKDFIYWGTRLSFEQELLLNVAGKARERAEELSGFEKSKESWAKVFELIFN